MQDLDCADGAKMRIKAWSNYFVEFGMLTILYHTSEVRSQGEDYALLFHKVKSKSRANDSITIDDDGMMFIEVVAHEKDKLRGMECAIPLGNIQCDRSSRQPGEDYKEPSNLCVFGSWLQSTCIKVLKMGPRIICKTTLYRTGGSGPAIVVSWNETVYRRSIVQTSRLRVKFKGSKLSTVCLRIRGALVERCKAREQIRTNWPAGMYVVIDRPSSIAHIAIAPWAFRDKVPCERHHEFHQYIPSSANVSFFLPGIKSEQFTF